MNQTYKKIYNNSNYENQNKITLPEDWKVELPEYIPQKVRIQIQDLDNNAGNNQLINNNKMSSLFNFNLNNITLPKFNQISYSFPLLNNFFNKFNIIISKKKLDNLKYSNEYYHDYNQDYEANKFDQFNPEDNQASDNSDIAQNLTFVSEYEDKLFSREIKIQDKQNIFSKLKNITISAYHEELKMLNNHRMILILFILLYIPAVVVLAITTLK